jgi:hypothetical protein
MARAGYQYILRLLTGLNAGFLLQVKRILVLLSPVLKIAFIPFLVIQTFSPYNLYQFFVSQNKTSCLQNSLFNCMIV